MPAGEPFFFISSSSKDFFFLQRQQQIGIAIKATRIGPPTPAAMAMMVVMLIPEDSSSLSELEVDGVVVGSVVVVPP